MFYPQITRAVERATQVSRAPSPAARAGAPAPAPRVVRRPAVPLALLAVGADFSQCADKNPTLGNCVWINSGLGTNNSQYVEGMSTPQRLLITGLTGSSH